MLEKREISEAVIGAAIRVHRELGPGLLESVYETCLAHELSADGREVARQVELPVRYRGLRLEAGYRLDLIVDGCVIVEIKAIESLSRLHEAQLLTYLRLSGHEVGLIINFNVGLLKDGIIRRVLTQPSLREAPRAPRYPSEERP